MIVRRIQIEEPSFTITVSPNKITGVPIRHVYPFPVRGDSLDPPNKFRPVISGVHLPFAGLAFSANHTRVKDTGMVRAIKEKSGAPQSKLASGQSLRVYLLLPAPLSRRHRGTSNKVHK